MKKYAPLFLVQLLFSSYILGCHRRPFHHKDYKIAAAESWLNDFYRKPVNDLCLYELLEALTDEFTQFFDATNNKESFNAHVKRMSAFVPLLQARIIDEDELRRDFEDHLVEYQTQFGKMMDFDTFKVMIKEVILYYGNMCEELTAQIKKRSSWQVCRSFYTFYKKLPASFINSITHISQSNFSQYWMFRTIRWRLNLKDQ